MVEWQCLKPPEPLRPLLRSHQDSGTKEMDGDMRTLLSGQRGHHLCATMHLQQPLSLLATHQFARERLLRNAKHKKQKEEKRNHPAYWLDLGRRLVSPGRGQDAPTAVAAPMSDLKVQLAEVAKEPTPRRAEELATGVQEAD